MKITSNIDTSNDKVLFDSNNDMLISVSVGVSYSIVSR